MAKRIGILALQGDFAAHAAALTEAGGAPVLVRDADALANVDGLVIPGGESTTMLKLLHYDNMMDALKAFAREKPVFGTCAGAILLAKAVTNPAQESLGIVDIAVERNAYGRQNESCIAVLDPEPEFVRQTGIEKLEAVFIRAPIIRSVGQGVRVLARFKGDPVLVEGGLHMVATFHPELSKGTGVHKVFVDRA